MPGSLQVPSLEELDVQEVSERPPPPGPSPAGAARRAGAEAGRPHRRSAPL